jgi:transcriptional regulator with XRE-family HTH domain
VARSFGPTVKLNPTRVRALRLARGWTQDQMAAESGLSQSWLQRAERFDKPYEADKVAVLARAHGVELQDLGVSDEDARMVEQAASAVIEARRILRRARRKRPGGDGSVKSDCGYPESCTHTGYPKLSEFAAAAHV